VEKTFYRPWELIEGGGGMSKNQLENKTNKGGFWRGPPPRSWGSFDKDEKYQKGGYKGGGTARLENETRFQKGNRRRRKPKGRKKGLQGSLWKLRGGKKITT